jgi:hypothetical protein
VKAVAPFLLGPLPIAGCSAGKPPVDEVAAIEAVTARNACVGALDRWHRVFAFQKRGNRISQDVISVTYIEAGHRGLAAGRVIGAPDGLNMIDDSQHRVAGGDLTGA